MWEIINSYDIFGFWRRKKAQTPVKFLLSKILAALRRNTSWTCFDSKTGTNLVVTGNSQTIGATEQISEVISILLN